MLLCYSYKCENHPSIVFLDMKIGFLFNKTMNAKKKQKTVHVLHIVQKSYLSYKNLTIEYDSIYFM